jgi:DNA repair protein RadC
MNEPTEIEVERRGPRERLMLHGENALSDAELIAVLLGTGTASDPVAVVAQKLVERMGGLSGLRRSGLSAMSACKGIGVSKACRIRAAIELGVRLSAKRLQARMLIECSTDVAEAMRPRLRDESREHFFVLALDARQRLTAEILVAVGGLTTCSVAPADVFRLVLREAAAAVIFVHNHPSGEPSPSREDVALTDRLRKAGWLLGINVVDHVIIGHDGHFSFLDAGMFQAGEPIA